jgi:hypothetical protein
MTGDARGDYILDGLRRAGRLDASGRARVDVLKVQHHGNARNTDRSFFDRVIASDYVISANGKDGNPDKDTLDAIIAARGQSGYRIWLTNRGATGTPLRQMTDYYAAAYPQVFSFRSDSALSLNVDVGTPVAY